MQRLRFVPSHPSFPHGTQSHSSWTTAWRPTNRVPPFRCAEYPQSIPSHGAQLNAPVGPKSATVGVPTAAETCIGAESTPTNRRAGAITAPSP